MRMIPSQPLNTNQSRAEQRVFDQLRSVFTASEHGDWFAMHSLNLPRHAHKRFGEIDFAVCGPGGLFVFEVKGGGVSCQEGVWRTRNRHGETQRLRESPFRQAEGALHGLIRKLPAALTEPFIVGYGVIMPDIDRLPEGAEWDRAVVADAKDFRQFDVWLKQLIGYWRAKSLPRALATSENVQAVQRYLRPDFEAIVPLHASVHELASRIVRLTDDQLRLVDVVQANTRVICSGGAGTGKTMLALELARRWTAAGMRVALACQSPWLKRYLERQAAAGLTISLIGSMPLTARRMGVDRFDAVIVDEGQDVLNLADLDRLDAHLHGGLAAGRWCFFHDANNQSGLCGTYVPAAYDYLEGLTPARVPLRTNCRNSLPILRRIQETVGADMGHPAVGDGPAVRHASAADAVEATLALDREIRALVNEEGFNPGDIVILSGGPYAQSCAAALAPDLRQQISILDDASPGQDIRHAIGFADIRDFKGLESEVVVLVDLPALDEESSMRALHYVGMSRARALLSVITTAG